MPRLTRYIADILIWLLILAGITVAGLRLTLANVDFFRADIESWVSYELAPGISFGEIRCYWNGIDPVLELNKTAITLQDRSRPIAVDSLSIQLDLWDTLLLGTPVIVEITGSIDKLVIQKDSEKQWWINDNKLAAADSGDAFGDVKDWLSSIPHFLQLEVERVIIEDSIRQRNYHINNIFADIQQRDRAIHVQLLANLPNAFGGAVEIKSILESGKGQVYLQAGLIKLSPIADLLDIPLKDFRRVELAGKAWIDLQEHRLSSVRGKVQIYKAVYQPKLHEPALPFQFAMDFNAENQQDQWYFAQHIENLLISEMVLPDIDMQWRILRHDDEKSVQGRIERLNISHYSNLLNTHLPPEYQQIVQQTNLQGTLRDIWFQLPLSEPSAIKLIASLQDMKSDRVDYLPAIDRIDAEIVYADRQVSAQLSSDHLKVDFGDKFRAPLHANRFNAGVNMRYNGDELVLAVTGLDAENADIRVGGRMWMESDFRTLPFMSMHLEYDQGLAGRKSKYLPVRLLPEKALKWLDDSIRGGDISNGHLIYHGRLQSIEKMDRNKSGELYAEFDLNNAEVQFDPDWAIAQQASGRLYFHNMGLDIELDSVTYDRVKKVSANIRLPTYANTSIIADIRAEAPTEDAMQTWLATPVGEDYREIAGRFGDLSGQINADVKLFIPLQDKTLSEDVNVRLDLKNAAAHAPDWGVRLSRARGLLTVTEDSVTARGISANFYGDPVEINVTTDTKRQQTLIRASGEMNTAQLFNVLPDSVTRGIDGHSEWEIDLAIANTAQSGVKPVLTIDARSNLQGTAVYFPAPLGKEATHNRQLAGTLLLQGDGNMLFNAHYRPDLRIRGRVMPASGGGYELADLDLAFATALTTVPSGGIHLYGKLARLPLDEWIVLHQTENARQQPGSPSLMPLLQSIDVAVEEIALFGRNLNDMDFRVKQTEAGFSGDLHSLQADGEFFFPWRDTVQNPVVINMKHLRLAKSVTAQNVSEWIPNDFFNARFRSEIFAYDGKEVTDLEIDTSIDGEFLLIDALSFKHNRLNFEAYGYWLYSAVTDIHDSFLALTVKGSEFGQSVAALGFGDTIHNGDIDFSGQLNWAGPITDPNWDIVRGEGRLRLENGILKDVEPGSGRFVGLFSLSALPRRLALDFSDVLFDGLEFDEIKGNLELRDASLYTSNTRLDGPAAEVKIVGRTGMRDRDYDQKIYVVPKIRQTLPVIGSIAAGSSVGWALLLLQNLLKSSIDETFEVEYSMTGSWDDPVIEALNKPGRDTAEPSQRTGNIEK